MDVEIAGTNEDRIWDLFPNEILIKVFECLNAKDLFACLFVSKRWRCIADYCGQSFAKWPMLVEEEMFNSGVTFRQKSVLSHRDLYLNSRMWSAVSKAHVKLKHVYNLEDVQNISVYKDNLIVVCNDSVRYYNIENGTIIKEIPGSYADYRETDFLIAKFTRSEGKKYVSLYSKRHDKNYESILYKLLNIQENKCYLFNFKNCAMFYECQPEDFVVRTLGRYYSHSSLLTSIFIYKEEMYLLIMKGDIFHYKKGDMHLKKFCSFEVPVPAGMMATNQSEIFMTMFHKYNLVYAVQNKEKEEFKKSIDNFGTEHLILIYANLTCTVEHGDILLLGFNDGKVGVVLANKLSTTMYLTPDLQFYIQDLMDVQDVHIKKMEVYEGENCHHVLVATRSNLYQFVISHADYKKVMP